MTNEDPKQIDDPTLEEGDMVDIAGVIARVSSKDEMQEIAITDGLTIVSLRCSFGPSLVEGTTKGLCGRCKQDVWISPSTRETAPLEANIRCMECMSEELEQREKSGE